jgi:hypothetical protein
MKYVQSHGKLNKWEFTRKAYYILIHSLENILKYNSRSLQDVEK